MDPFRKRKIFLSQLISDLAVEFNTNSTILNAQQIEEVARLNPVKVSDFEAIKGLGEQFQNQYGQLIVDRLQAFNKDQVTLNQSSSVNQTLSELQKRLINISKRNRLLYVGKTSPKTTYDLSELTQSGLNELLFENKKIKLVDLKDEQSKERYTSLKEINKNVQKAFRETGNEDLYVATPFVIGEFISDPFTLRAPLALFPMKMDITNSTISIELDSDKDVLINTNLIVASQNFLKTNLPLIPMGLEEITPETFLEDLLVSYAQQGFQIGQTSEELKAFVPKTIEDFKTLKPGLFEVENVALLGYFPILSTSIQRDYAAITHLEDFPPHVLTLLETLQLDENQEVVPPLDDIVFNEAHLAYINPLNSSQEQAQLQIKKGQHLVIEGPPGTGKSQTISNVIAQSIFDGKNVLMVSEKKAAIDVVYSRLAQLNQFALILDNINDKQNFYRQCEHLFSEQIQQFEEVSLDKQNEAMNELLSDLDRIKTLLLSDLQDGITPLKLYSEIDKIDYTQPEVFKDYDFLKKTVPSPLNYQTLSQLDPKELDGFTEINQQTQLKKQISHIDQVNLSLSDYDIVQLKMKLDEVKKDIQEYESSNFIAKLLNKKKVDEALQPYQTLYPSVDASKVNELEFILNNYNSLNQPLKHKLDESLTLLLDKLTQQFNESPQASLSRLKNFVGFELLQTFENQNRDLAQLISTFPQLVNSFNESANEKSDLLMSKLQKELYQNTLKLKNSKRALEMKRIIERKRKWSIAKFVDKFYVELFDGIKIWLCTPDVVSEIFPLKSDLFDVLIFDEASQLYIEKAIPSILRSKQVVIAGDSQQLRPSAFGVGRYGYDEELEDEFVDSTAALDEESLLDLARFKFPSTTLNYHYRSLFEELIAFSNAAFYKNQLIVSPNALLASIPPLKRIKVENGLWQKRANQAESKAVVELIKEISKTRQKNETIGVITFNATQRTLIESDLEKEAIADPEFGLFYQQESVRTEENQDLSLFVKNIENVQGDERDIIIFSITYAPDESGKVPSFFGWLSQQGGENRLNVAITRAKKQIYVVTSIESHQLPVGNSTYAGPKLLQQYLEYATYISSENDDSTQVLLNQLSPSVENEKQATLHPLTQKVKTFLEEQGYQVRSQYGIGQFTVELAVFKDEQLVAGLEFDHTQYKKLPLADRARDIHQPNYLKVRGWKLIRLFGYDAYHHPDTFYTNLLQLIA